MYSFLKLVILPNTWTTASQQGQLWELPMCQQRRSTGPGEAKSLISEMVVHSPLAGSQYETTQSQDKLFTKSVSFPVYEFPVTTVKNYHKFSGLKQHKYIYSNIVLELRV